MKVFDLKRFRCDEKLTQKDVADRVHDIAIRIRCTMHCLDIFK